MPDYALKSLVADMRVGELTTYRGRSAQVVKVRGVKTFRMLGHIPEALPRLNDGRDYQCVGTKGNGTRYVQATERF